MTQVLTQSGSPHLPRLLSFSTCCPSLFCSCLLTGLRGYMIISLGGFKGCQEAFRFISAKDSQEDCMPCSYQLSNVIAVYKVEWRTQTLLELPA